MAQVGESCLDARKLLIFLHPKQHRFELTDLRLTKVSWMVYSPGFEPLSSTLCRA